MAHPGHGTDQYHGPRKREQADAQDEIRGNKIPLTWGDFNQHLQPPGAMPGRFWLKFLQVGGLED